uniref:Macaca fascicularis brain cDNA, clone: QflA-19295 n=1 Tax=Macaca fascicularis TaxID=9541 RepID=I7GLS6_MACFA|nr:unnamed protein product [Macaca fascicularis]
MHGNVFSERFKQQRCTEKQQRPIHVNAGSAPCPPQRYSV